jgi:hypothetical protein
MAKRGVLVSAAWLGHRPGDLPAHARAPRTGATCVLSPTRWTVLEPMRSGRMEQTVRGRSGTLAPGEHAGANCGRGADSEKSPLTRIFWLVEAMGLEPTNLLTASQALYQLSYAPSGGHST